MANPDAAVRLYANIGAELIHYDLDVATAALTRRGSVALPANVQYAWPHASRRFLYVATSDSASGNGPAGNTHHLVALRIEPGGALALHGDPVALPTRPIHMATDIPSAHALIAFNNPSALRVYRINPDGTVAGEVSHSGPGEAGIFGHQVRVTPDNRSVILVARGHDAAGGKPEEPGALQVFDYRAGKLGAVASVAPGGGYGFGPRHLDFHPNGRWVYVSLERQNRVDLFTLADGRLSPEAVYQADTLAQPHTGPARQAVGTVHVHPDGHTVYVANRASSTVAHGGRQVLGGGENTLAVFRIDPASGEPTLVQNVDTRGIHCRTFHIDPSGRLLVAAHIMGLPVRDGAAVREVPACLSMFRIGADGTLDFIRKHDMALGNKTMWWMGLVAA